ncbi:MAG: class I SAM-dependent methyltransferase [bacterium]
MLNTLLRILDEARRGRLLLHAKRRFGDRAAAFAAIEALGYWNAGMPGESASGPGSALAATATIRQAIARIVRERNVSSVFDAACGDFNWMRHVDLGAASYEGADIVPRIVDAAARRYGGTRRRFRLLDVVNGPIPRVDLILCRDLFIHLKDEDVLAVLANFSSSGSTYLLAATSPMLAANRRIARAGAWRPINLCIAPFSLPRPIEQIPDLVCDDSERATVLGLWPLPLTTFAQPPS